MYLYGSSSIKGLVAEEVFLRLLHKPAIQSATIWSDEHISSAGKHINLEMCLKCVLH